MLPCIFCKFECFKMNTVNFPNAKRLLEDDGIGQCELMGLAGLVLQAVLGGVVILVLVCKNHPNNAQTTHHRTVDKRIREKPRRHWKIWMLDVSKQIVSALTAHFLNVLLATVLNENTTTAETDACGWYYCSPRNTDTLCLGISSRSCSIPRLAYFFAISFSA